MSAPGTLSSLPPVHPEGRKFVIIAAAIALLFFLLGWSILGWLAIGLTLWVAAFFRDPARTVPQTAGAVISPADGVICQIAEVVPPTDLDLGAAPLTRVSIFMSVFDVHINRAPGSGVVRRMVYIPGKFLNAAADKASEENERQLWTLRRDDGVDIGFVQIAGLVARRIVPFVREGERVIAGERVGLIRFGSRVDVFLPAGTGAKVAIGQRMIAGETIVGLIGDATVAQGLAK
jgi:phosphatidylserine decarboxylase